MPAPALLKTIASITALAVLPPLLAGCASTESNAHIERQLQQQQCVREASNRPDEVQRRIECEQRMLMEPATGSDPLDT